MALAGKGKLKADRYLAAGTEANIFDMFSFEERSRRFPVDQPVRRDETRFRINVAKVGAIDVTSDATLPKGFYTSLELLMRWTDMAKRMVVSDSVKKDEALAVTVES